MPLHFGFEPDAERARALDLRMRRELAASLRYVLAECGQAPTGDDQRLAAVLDGLEAGSLYPATTFARYYALVDSLLAGDEATASGEIDALAGSRPLTSGQVLQPIEDPGRCQRSALYADRLLEDLPEGLSLQPPRPQAVAAFECRYGDAMAILRGASPALAGEIDALVHEVVPVAGGVEDRGTFEGGSHFQLWGALFLNADLHETPLALAEAIAHESAHSLLFAFCTEEPLVLNGDEERYPSPLRADPRPMDGIYHATFVSARMHWALGRLIEGGDLTAEQRAWAREAAAEDARNFVAGERVVARHGRLSRHGAALLDGARAYMAQAGA